MNEVFILYRNVKITAKWIELAVNPFWEDSGLKSKFAITFTSTITGKSDSFNWYAGANYSKELDPNQIVEAFLDLLQDSSYGGNSWEGYCAEFDLDLDSLKAKATFEYIQKENASMLSIEPDFDFGADVEFIDNGIEIHNNRLWSSNHDLWSRPSDAILLFDGEEIEAIWECNRAHPGGDSTHGMGDGWVDCENRMPFVNEDVYWTHIFDNKPKKGFYSIQEPTIKLIQFEPEEDDDYYATL